MSAIIFDTSSEWNDLDNIEVDMGIATTQTLQTCMQCIYDYAYAIVNFQFRLLQEDSTVSTIDQQSNDLDRRKPRKSYIYWEGHVYPSAFQYLCSQWAVGSVLTLAKSRVWSLGYRSNCRLFMFITPYKFSVCASTIADKTSIRRDWMTFSSLEHYSLDCCLSRATCCIFCCILP